jgi:hypothetical protein
LAISSAKIPRTVKASQPQSRGRAVAAKQAARKIDAKEASEIFGSASRQTPVQNFPGAAISLVLRQSCTAGTPHRATFAGNFRSYFPLDSDEFIVVTPLVDQLAASRFLKRAAKSLRQFFSSRLDAPRSIYCLELHYPLQRILATSPLLLVAKNLNDVIPLSRVKA